jgi:hypothetical protein
MFEKSCLHFFSIEDCSRQRKNVATEHSVAAPEANVATFCTHYLRVVQELARLAAA